MAGLAAGWPSVRLAAVLVCCLGHTLLLSLGMAGVLGVGGGVGGSRWTLTAAAPGLILIGVVSLLRRRHRASRGRQR